MIDLGIKTAVIGGDTRMLTVACELAALGTECTVCGFDGIALPQSVTRTDSMADAVMGAAAVILPLPVSRDRLHINAPFSSSSMLVMLLMALMKPEQLLFGGMIDPVFAACHEKTYDYYESEALKLKNAVPTAEGAVAIAMKELPVTILGSSTAVTGFGRCGRALALRLAWLGSKVTVFARKSADRALASSLGMNAAGFEGMAETLCGFDCVFNTVPVHVFGKPELEALRGKVLIDIAGGEGAADRAEAEVAGVSLIAAPGLPGKTAPVTAGRIIAGICADIMREEKCL